MTTTRRLSTALVVTLLATTATSAAGQSRAHDRPVTGTAPGGSATPSAIDRTPAPFDEIVPLKGLDEGTPAAEQYLSFDHARDLDDDRAAVSLLAGQVEARGADRGFAGLVTDGANRAITVHWKGTAPDDVRASLAASPYGVAVTLVEGARYSRQEGTAATARVVEHSDVESWGINGASSDWTGIDIHIRGGKPSGEVLRTIVATAGIDEDDIDWIESDGRFHFTVGRWDVRR